MAACTEFFAGPTMTQPSRTPGLLPLLAAALALSAGCSRQAAEHSWDAPAAARYLDDRAATWLGWPKAARDHGTVCISCHTSLPYVLARSELQQRLGEHTAAEPERKLLDSVRQRVGMWEALAPWYDTQKQASRATEAVINALVLARADAESGNLSAVTRAALEHMWETQDTQGGSWPWIAFNNEPWEAPDSAYYGATLAALAVGFTPDSYRQEQEVQARSAQLAGYLRREYPGQSLASRLDLLWAAARWPELLGPGERAALASELAAAQLPDGGWSLATLLRPWKRHNGTALPDGSDGYATGFVCYVLQQAGTPASDPHVSRGLGWLMAHQSRWNGRWHTESPNRANGWTPTEGNHFMDDAATAFAALALMRSEQPAAVARAAQASGAR
jgi:squalene-hopene/tetraprenyl-beta-curcumene cyclase